MFQEMIVMFLGLMTELGFRRDLGWVLGCNFLGLSEGFLYLLLFWLTFGSHSGGCYGTVQDREEHLILGYRFFSGY